MMRYIFMIGIVFVIGCDMDENTRMSINAPVVEVVGDRVVPVVVERFRVMKVQMIRDPDAYKGLRSIYVIRDRVTNREYMGITGVGISDMGVHSIGKVNEVDER